MFTLFDLFVLILYFIAMLLIGWALSKRVKARGMEEFAVSSKSTGLFPLVMTVIGTHIGSGLTLGLVAKIYVDGIQAVWIGLAWFLGAILWTMLLAKRIRKMAAKEGWGYTMGDLFEERLGKPGRFLYGTIATWERMAITGGQLVACGVLLSTIGAGFGIDLKTATIISGLIVIAYVTLGGLTAVIWTDVIQALIMIAGIGIILPIILTTRMSWGDLLHATASSPGFFTPIPHSIPIIATAAAWFTGVLGNQSLWQKTVCAKDEKTAYLGNLLGAIVGIAWGFMMVWIAFAVKSIVPNFTGNTESLLLNMIVTTFPIGIIGLIIAAQLSAIMSTASSCLLNGAINFSHDLYAKIIRQTAQPAEVLKVSRIATPLIGLIPIIFALWVPKIIEVQNLGYGMYGPAVTAPFWAVLFWRKLTPQGGIAGMIFGLAVGLYWYINQIGPLPYALAGLIASAIALIVVSLLTQKSLKQPTSLDT